MSADPRVIWVKQHRGPMTNGLWKAVYVTRQGARDMARRINRESPKPGFRVSAYRCRWTDDPADGETAPVHWHVGRVRTL